MHWYYRINRATNKHCWYLGPGGVHVRSHTATAAVKDPPGARKANPVDADNAAPMQAMPADGAEPAAPVQTAFAQAQTANAQTALPQAPPADQAATANQAVGGPGFGARWPGDLRKRKIWSRASRRRLATAMPKGATRTRPRKCRRNGPERKRATRLNPQQAKPLCAISRSWGLL